MKKRLLFIVLFAALSLLGIGCSDPEVEEPRETPVGETPADSPAGLRLANGLYDLEEGKVQAIGVLEWVDLEGGFYAITGKPESEGDGNIAVIANWQDFQRQLEPLRGKTVSAIGTKLDGASIRMAGPEIEIESVEEISDTPGPAE